MNITQLRYLKAVARTGSFTRAAEECFVTQPTLSNAIAQLEEEFEQLVFTRTTRRVTLTDFGRSILPFVEETLLAEKNLLQQVRAFARPDHPTVRVGLSPLTSSDWLRRFLDDFRQTGDQAEIRLHEQNMADLYLMLDDGLLDLVFGVAGTVKTNWEAKALYEEPLFYIPRGRRAETAPGPVVIDQVAGETFVMVPNACGLAPATRALFRSRRKKLKEYSGEALSYQVLEQWAGLGLGAAILPRSKLSGPDHGAVPLVDQKGRPIPIKFQAVWLRTGPRPALVQKFIDYIISYDGSA